MRTLTVDEAKELAWQTLTLRHGYRVPEETVLRYLDEMVERGDYERTADGYVVLEPVR